MHQLGGYTLTHRLGVGGMGEVWKGRREALGGAAVDVAIKILSRGKIDDTEARRMFLDEARLSMLLATSNIVKVFDAAETDDGTCFMVMEWVDGLNLAQLNKQVARAGEWYSDTLIAYIVGEILKGLAHAHDLRHGSERLTIVHRDISAHNVMCSVNGEVKVMDFGIARMASEETSGIHVKGKLRYMSPEQLRGDTREPTLDLFAAGAILHELLDGVPFRSKVLDEGRLYGMILVGEVPPMQRDPETIPVELEQLRQSLLDPDPHARVQSAREAFQWLSNWSGYRDARFELDEIVRRHAEARAAASPPPTADPKTVVTTARGMPVSQAASSLAGASASASVSASASASASVSASASTSALTDPTVVLQPGDSVTHLDLPATPPPATQRRKLIPIGLALLGVAILSFGVATAMFRKEQPKEPAKELAARQPTTPTGAPPTTPGDAPPPQDRPAPAPATQPAAPAAPAIEAEPTAAASQPAAKTQTKTKTKTKVSLSLASGVKWAEIKIGGRRVVLDAFDKKSGSIRLAPGEYSSSARTKFDGPWRKGPHLELESGAPVSIRVHKSGGLTLH